MCINIKLKIKHIIKGIIREMFNASKPVFVISHIAATMVIGIDNRKENLKASSLLRPRKSAAAIVVPDLEMPGNMANTWNSPTNKAIFQVISLDS